jgi:epoxyqueuosine reductase
MLADLWNYSQLRKISRTLGAGLFGVADISAIKADFELSEGTKKRLNRAVCLGVGLSFPVLSEIEQEPTKLYFHHYRTANMFLDQMAFAVAGWIQERGFQALPVPASQIIDWESQKAHLSHKKIGVLAGIGWIGRNNLLVSKKFGAQFRLTTILTDMPLSANKPVREDCGQCVRCLDVCPVGAIGKDLKDFKHLACFEKLKDFQKQNIVGQFICGVCVKACGKKK